MSNASATDNNGNLVQINVRVTQQFLDQIDDAWQGRGFNSRSEFIRYVLHDATEHPTFDRDELLALALAEREMQEGDTISRDDIIDQFDLATEE